MRTSPYSLLHVRQNRSKHSRHCISKHLVLNHIVSLDLRYGVVDLWRPKDAMAAASEFATWQKTLSPRQKSFTSRSAIHQNPNVVECYIKTYLRHSYSFSSMIRHIIVPILSTLSPQDGQLTIGKITRGTTQYHLRARVQPIRNHSSTPQFRNISTEALGSSDGFETRRQPPQAYIGVSSNLLTTPRREPVVPFRTQHFLCENHGTLDQLRELSL
jgi:hypothetical protein